LFGAPAFLFPDHDRRDGWLLYQDRSRSDVPSRATVAFRAVGFVLTLITSCGLASLHFTAPRYPSSAGGVLGSFVGQGFEAGLSFLGATLIMLALWLAGVSLFAGVSWIEIMDRTGRVTLNTLAWLSGRISNAREIKAGREVKEARKEVVREEQKRVANRPPPKIEPVVHKVEKSERHEKERQAALFERPTSKELPALSLLDDAPARVSRLFRRGARSDVAAGRAEATRLRRRGRSRRSASRARDHALRAAAGARRESQPDLEPCEGSGARVIRGQRAHSRSDSGQVDRRPRNSQ
jgi:S-DNA-T family DNA segregation ATPase FtsK/SpoIIIE